MAPILHVPTLQDFKATAKQDIFLQIPQIDRFAWHPFTIMQHKSQPDGTGLLTMQIKRYSDWTKELFVRSQVSLAAWSCMAVVLCAQPGQRCYLSLYKPARSSSPAARSGLASCCIQLQHLGFAPPNVCSLRLAKITGLACRVNANHWSESSGQEYICPPDGTLPHRQEHHQDAGCFGSAAVGDVSLRQARGVMALCPTCR